MTDFAEVLERELARWPGIEYSIETSKKHPRIVLCRGDTCRFVVISATPSDRRAYQNRISDVRRILRLLTEAAND